MTASNTPAPKVSIGMPVYNSEQCVRRAIDSLLAQTFTDFELIISDNASTDETGSICRDYAAGDSRVRYVRQAENRGAVANFQFVLEAAVGEHFMWAAADDAWGPNFIARNSRFLDAHGDFVASVSGAAIGEDSNRHVAGTTVIADDDPQRRIMNFVRRPGGNTRFYSLYRRAALSDLNLNGLDYLGGDWSAIVSLLKKGKFNCFEEHIEMSKGPFGFCSDIIRLFESYPKTVVEYLFPLWKYSTHVLKESRIRDKHVFNVCWHLLKWNFKFAGSYYRRKFCVSVLAGCPPQKKLSN